jgi:hypothetical protein
MEKEAKSTPTIDELKSINNLFKVYRGIIEDNNSPKIDGRVQVRIFGIHSQDKTLVPTSTLPWAEVMQPLSFGYGTGIGITSLPRTGTWVFVILDNDNPNQPIVIGAVAGTPTEAGDYELPISSRLGQSDVNDLAVPGYPDNHVIETLAGHIIEIDDNAGNERIRICHTNGNEVLLNNEGIHVSSIKDRTELTAGKFSGTVLNTFTMSVTGAIQINTSESINITSNGPAIIKTNNDLNILANSNINISSNADTNISVDGNAKLNVVGNVNSIIHGLLDVQTTGTSNIFSTGASTLQSSGAVNITSGASITLKSASNTMVI